MIEALKERVEPAEPVEKKRKLMEEERTDKLAEDLMEDERTDKVPAHMATWRLPGAIPYQDFMECFNTKPSVVLYKARTLNTSHDSLMIN